MEETKYQAEDDYDGESVQVENELNRSWIFYMI